MATWFSEAVAQEIRLLEKEGGSVNHEVISGRLIDRIDSNQGIFRFVIADSTHIPEDASGKLKTETQEFTATVVGLEGDRIDIHLESSTPVPEGIDRGTLVVDDTALLRRLLAALEKAASSPGSVGPLATEIFHPGGAKPVNAALPDQPLFQKLSPEHRLMISQACGSQITFVWGPPGTGKTFGIAYLIAALIENDERVLVASHTHAAVDQALYAAVQCEADRDLGPLADHLLVKQGKVLRIGRTSDRRVPDKVRLDKVIKSKCQGIERLIAELTAEAKYVQEKIVDMRKDYAAWTRFELVQQQWNESGQRLVQMQAKLRQADDLARNGTMIIEERKNDLERARSAWFWRSAKTNNAENALRLAQQKLLRAEQDRSNLTSQIQSEERTKNALRISLVAHKAKCGGFPSKLELKRAVAALEAEHRTLWARIGGLQEEISKIEATIVADARVIFCTLTKNFTAKELEGQRFDAVIADEISMALPPLLFLAAGRSRKRIILVGDFLQLPPIVKSDSPMSRARLRQDIFHLAGAAEALKPSKDFAALTKLTTQRRMVPDIADVARHLAYGTDGLADDPILATKTEERWMSFLPSSPLIIVDTADLNCWCGRQPGSLSRFNVYSAILSVELAGMAASGIPREILESRPSIGVITPYAAQRRLHSKLVEQIKLNPWVAIHCPYFSGQ